jgi:hypothetical protein
MKVSVNPRVQKILDIYSTLTPEKREALDKVIDAFVKENEDDKTEETQTGSQFLQGIFNGLCCRNGIFVPSDFLAIQ